MNNYTLETVRQIWNDQSGDRIEVGPDRDSLGFIEIRQVGSDGKIQDSILVPTECSALLINAVNACSREIIEAKGI